MLVEMVLCGGGMCMCMCMYVYMWWGKCWRVGVSEVLKGADGGGVGNSCTFVSHVGFRCILLQQQWGVWVGASRP
jgi:hypothetical protein